MSRIAATERMARLVAAIPWIVAQNGAPVDEIAERFDYPRQLLLDDLRDVVFYVGVPPYTPDTLIEVQIDDDMVWINYADWFSRPMRLNEGEALALLAAGESVLAFDNQDEAGALARGLAKLRLATGAAADVLQIELGVAQESVLNDLREAVHAGMCVDITYYSFARDSRSARRIEPLRFFSDQGNWYVAAYCHLADAPRVFRLDRIERLATTGQPIDEHRREIAEPGFSIDRGPRATLRLPADRMVLLDGVATDSVDEVSESDVEVTLPISSRRWLERLLVRGGAGVRLLSVDETLGKIDAETAADRVLGRYREA